MQPLDARRLADGTPQSRAQPICRERRGDNRRRQSSRSSLANREHKCRRYSNSAATQSAAANRVFALAATCCTWARARIFAFTRLAASFL